MMPWPLIIDGSNLWIAACFVGINVVIVFVIVNEIGFLIFVVATGLIVWIIFGRMLSLNVCCWMVRMLQKSGVVLGIYPKSEIIVVSTPMFSFYLPLLLDMLVIFMPIWWCLPFVWLLVGGLIWLRVIMVVQTCANSRLWLWASQNFGEVHSNSRSINGEYSWRASIKGMSPKGVAWATCAAAKFNLGDTGTTSCNFAIALTYARECLVEHIQLLPN